MALAVDAGRFGLEDGAGEDSRSEETIALGVGICEGNGGAGAELAVVADGGLPDAEGVEIGAEALDDLGGFCGG